MTARGRDSDRSEKVRIGQRAGHSVFVLLALLAACSSTPSPPPPTDWGFTLTAATVDIDETGNLCHVKIQDQSKLSDIVVKDEQGRVVGVFSAPPATGRLVGSECDVDMKVDGIPEDVYFVTISSPKLGEKTIARLDAEDGYTFVLS